MADEGLVVLLPLLLQGGEVLSVVRRDALSRLDGLRVVDDLGLDLGLLLSLLLVLLLLSLLLILLLLLLLLGLLQDLRDLLLDVLLVLDGRVVGLLDLRLGGAKGSHSARRGGVQVANRMRQGSNVLPLNRNWSRGDHWSVVHLLLVGNVELRGLFDDVLLVLGHGLNELSSVSDVLDSTEDGIRVLLLLLLRLLSLVNAEVLLLLLGSLLLELLLLLILLLLLLELLLLLLHLLLVVRLRLLSA